MQNPSAQWLKNIKTIRENAEPRMIMNSKLYSFPPIVQYYDVVGTVNVDSLSKIQEYKREVENEIYQWLDNNCSFGTKIFKSDIVKFFNKRPETSYVDLDIRVSDIIKAQDVKYIYSLQTTNLQNVLYYNINNDRNKVAQNTNNMYYNCLKLPKADNAGSTLNVDSLKNKTIRIIVTDNGVDKIDQNIFTNNDVFETESNVFINFNGYERILKSQASLSNNATLKLLVSYGEDFYSTSNYSLANAYSYGLTRTKAANLQNFVSNWVKKATAVRDVNRAIPLPYFISVLGQNTREETILRKGILQNSYETQLTEKAFWMYLIPTIIKTYYQNIDFSEEEINGEAWTHVDNLVRDLYTQFKATFADSILDDNNNIVNFSMDNELPVVRLKITYKYGV
jgi:hypothetical protein